MRSAAASIILLAAATLASAAGAQNGAAPHAPPETEARPVVETLHGEEIVDPYRWLEGHQGDPRRLSPPTPEVAAWTDAQNAFTRATLDALPGRATLEARIRELLELGETGEPVDAGTRTFFTRRRGAQPQAALYVSEGEGEPRVLLDPAALDESGLLTIGWFSPSPDGALVAVGTYLAGDENTTLHLVDAASGEWLADEIPGKTRMAGWIDGRSFVYTRLEDVGDPYSRAVALHKIGRHWTADPVLVRQREAARLYEGAGLSEDRLAALLTTWGPFARPGRDGRWLTVGYWTGTSSNDLWVASLADYERTGRLELRPIAVGDAAEHEAYAAGDAVYVLTQLNAPNGRLVRVSPHDTAKDRWTELVPHRQDVVLRGFHVAGGVLAVETLRDASTAIELYTLEGRPLGDLPLPGMGSASLSASPDRTSAYLRYESFNTPPTIYRVDLARPAVANGEAAEPARTVFSRVEVPGGAQELEVKRVKYSSKDGTEVGMFVVHRPGIQLNGENPVLLHGYGGFGLTEEPEFDATLLPWFDAGGVYAVANLRGGGEKGQAWHRAGMLERKQNVFDDFIAAAAWLIENGYTSPQKLGITGRSNGGLLAGAAVTQRPDLFAAAIVGVPLLDMLRYEKYLMARFWVPEYGSAVDPDQYRTLRAYSPYHNIEPGTKYPAVLLTAGENDARVHPLHARKMAARLQASTSADPASDPILLWTDRVGGHGAGKPLHLRVREVTDRRIFMMWQLGVLGGQ